MFATPSKPLLYLIGYRGTGKTTVGQIVASRRNVPFADADEHLERAAGMTIRQIFNQEGEPSFRDRESATLRELSQLSRGVIATGGGIILRPENRRCLKETGFVVWLAAPVDVLAARIMGDPATADRRPNLMTGGREEIAQLLKVREPMYRECADVEIDASERSPEALAEAILSAWIPSGSTPSG